LQEEKLFFQKEQEKERRQKTGIKEVLFALQKENIAQAGKSIRILVR